MIIVHLQYSSSINLANSGSIYRQHRALLRFWDAPTVKLEEFQTLEFKAPALTRTLPLGTTCRRAFCVVLSGTGSDGAVGLSRIKEQGGVTLAQHPEDAEFDSMPRAAIDTGKVDFVLPVVDVPQKILDLWHNAQRIQLPHAADIQPGSAPELDERAAAHAEQALLDILAKLRASTGHDFRHYKRATVLRRIERRMQVTTQPDLPAYLRYLCEHVDETKALLDDMLIGVTNFFRARSGPPAHRLPAMPGGRYARTMSSSQPSNPRKAKKPSTVELYQRAAEQFSPPSIGPPKSSACWQLMPVIH